MTPHCIISYDVTPKIVPIILILFSILFGTYYSQNYASIIYKGLPQPTLTPLFVLHSGIQSKSRVKVFQQLIAIVITATKNQLISLKIYFLFASCFTKSEKY